MQEIIYSFLNAALYQPMEEVEALFDQFMRRALQSDYPVIQVVSKVNDILAQRHMGHLSVISWAETAREKEQREASQRSLVLA